MPYSQAYGEERVVIGILKVTTFLVPPAPSTGVSTMVHGEPLRSGWTDAEETPSGVQARRGVGCSSVHDRRVAVRQPLRKRRASRIPKCGEVK